MKAQHVENPSMRLVDDALQVQETSRSSVEVEMFAHADASHFTQISKQLRVDHPGRFAQPVTTQGTTAVSTEFDHASAEPQSTCLDVEQTDQLGNLAVGDSQPEVVGNRVLGLDGMGAMENCRRNRLEGGNMLVSTVWKPTGQGARGRQDGYAFRSCSV